MIEHVTFLLQKPSDLKDLIMKVIREGLEGLVLKDVNVRGVLDKDVIGDLWLTHWGRDKIVAILQTTFSNAISWMKMFEFLLKFHWSLFLNVQWTIFQYWFW